MKYFKSSGFYTERDKRTSEREKLIFFTSEQFSCAANLRFLVKLTPKSKSD